MILELWGMNKMASLIKVEGDIEEVTDMSLQSLQELVGGYIQIVPTNDGRQMVLNEEGKLKGLLINPRATHLTRGVVADNDLIVGDVVVAGMKEIE